MRILTLACCATAPVLLQAQQPFPTWAQDPTWSVLECVYGLGYWCNTDQFQFTDSAILCGHTYSMLLSPWDTTYFRNEGQRTLFRRDTDCLAKEYLIYDYSIDVGDTVFAGLNMEWSQPDTAMFVPQSIDTVLLFGTARRRFLMNYDRCNQGDLLLYSTMYWIEGIGSTKHPFYPLVCVCDACETGYMLLCHDSAAVQLYQDTVLHTCDTTYTDVGIGDQTELGNGTLSIVVNGSTISIIQPPDLKQGYLRILDMAGRVLSIVPAGGADQVLDVSALPPGGYALVFNDADGRSRVARWVHAVR